MNFANKIKIANVFYDRSFQKYWLARFLSSLCLGTLNVCIAWQIYDISRNPLHLGLIGLTQFVPLILLVVVTGYFADNFNRKKIFYTSLLGEGLLILLFFVINFINYANIPLLFIILIGIGIIRAFFSPAASALLPNIINKIGIFA